MIYTFYFLKIQTDKINAKKQVLFSILYQNYQFAFLTVD